MFRRLRRLLGLAGRHGTETFDPDAAPKPVEGENHLLISDLHLGEACKEHSRIEYLKRSADLDEHLCGFLDHFTTHRPEGRPWRLVLCGDTIDFLQVTIVPSGADAVARRYGLGTREPESVWKLARIIERHRRVFVYLAAFVGAGHRLEIIQGNHDVEFFWPKVRDAFTRRLADLFFGDESTTGADTHAAFMARVHFNGWFYYQPGLIYAEHGHRFDDFCATPPQLCPLRPQDEDELVQPLSGLAIRYFANLERGFQTHDKEHWGPREYTNYYRRKGLSGALEVGGRYLKLLRRVTSYHLQHGRFISDSAQRTHDQRMHALAAQDLLTDAQLHTLDAMSARPATADPFALYTMMSLAELTGAAAVMSVGLLILLTSFGWLVDLTMLGATLAGAVVWARYARHHTSTDVRGKLRDAAAQISALLDVPVVAMGHAHAARRDRMAENHRAFYVNTGHFLPPHRAVHTGDATCDCSTHYVELLQPEPDERPVPKLRRWCSVTRQGA